MYAIQNHYPKANLKPILAHFVKEDETNAIVLDAFSILNEN